MLSSPPVDVKMILMRLKGLIGPKYIQQLQNASNSLMGFGAVAGIGLLYFTDWRLILQYVPVVKRKFKEDS